MPYHYFAGWLPKDPVDLREWLKKELRKNRLRYGLDPETGTVPLEKQRTIYKSLDDTVQDLQDYKEMMRLISTYIGEAPTFSSGPSGYVSGV